MIEDVRDVDPSPLRGRLIMLDPGHGGKFRGAVGPNGLAEADVNLGVALYLRGLLEWAGADVVMTRTTDRDFLTAADTTLASDLAFRVSMMDSLQPDVFISLHHNSNPSRDPTINETQTYYRLGDEGASLELARAIHRHLALNLQITPAKILPGNFHVLREATVPAVLGEPAMLSNPVMAGRLSLAASQRLEAEAYFLGLLDYFAQGAPAWHTSAPDSLALPAEGELPTVSWIFLVDHGHRGEVFSAPGLPGPDPDSFRVEFGGRPQPFALSPDGRTVTWAPPSRRKAGPLVISGRNLAGRSTPADTVLILPSGSRPPRVSLWREADDRGAVLIGWERTGTTDSPGGTLAWDQGPTIDVASSSGGGRLLAGPAEPWWGKPALWIPTAGGDTVACAVTRGTLPRSWHWQEIRGLPAGQHGGTAQHRWRYRLGTLPPGLDPGLVPDGFAAVPDSGTWLERDGLLPLLDVQGQAIPQQPRPLQATLLEPDAWGRTVVIDPRGGGTETDGQGPLGTRGADLNLEVAQLTAAYLTGAGAHVLLTRAGDMTMNEPDKVLLARDARADLFLVIGRRGSGAAAPIRHYPGSSRGSSWARATAGMLTRARVGSDSLAIGAGADYLLRHTHCPALVVELPGLPDASAEIREGLPANQRAEASALAMGILGYLADRGAAYPTLSLPSLVRTLPGAPAVAEITGALWDGNITPAVGDAAATFAGPQERSSVTLYDVLLPGNGTTHQLELHTGDTWQVWLLQRDASGWRGRKVRDGS